MKIIRDGKEYELTHTEMYDAYRACKRELLIDDIKSKAIEMELDVPGNDFERIADIAEKGLDNNDSLWESYLMTIEYALEK